MSDHLKLLVYVSLLIHESHKLNQFNTIINQRKTKKSKLSLAYLRPFSKKYLKWLPHTQDILISRKSWNDSGHLNITYDIYFFLNSGSLRLVFLVIIS